MQKNVSTSELDTIERVVSQYKEGAHLGDLLQSKELSLSRRTLQRRLQILTQTGRLKISGKGKHVRYSVSEILFPYGNFQIPLSHEAKVIQNYVNQPLDLRRPTTYNHAFLNSYTPNETYYLSSRQREYLKGIGSHIASPSQQIAGTVAKKIFNHLLIDLSWNSSRLEGNTYSLLETQRLIEFGEAPQNKSTIDTQMLLNHKAAIEFLIESAQEISYNQSTILNLHALLSDNLLSNSSACGRLRTISVAITKTFYSPINIPQVIEEVFHKILACACEISDPFEQAFFTMIHLPYLQPFEDVNKRVSRLAANISLIQKNLSPLSFVDVPENAYIDGILGVYELNRVELLRDLFIWAYERSVARYTTARQILGEPDPFRLHYRAQMIEIIKTIIDMSLNSKESINFMDTWINNHIQKSDQKHFKEVVETELLTIHKGNIARFRVKESEFLKWQQKFTK